MSPTALALIASAAIAHASWNFFAKQARGGLPFVWLAGVCAATLYALPAAIQLLVGSRSSVLVEVVGRTGAGLYHIQRHLFIGTPVGRFVAARS